MVLTTMMVVVVILFGLCLASFVAVSSILAQLFDPSQLFLLFFELFLFLEFFLVFFKFFFFLVFLPLALVHRRVHTIVTVIVLVHVYVVTILSQHLTLLLGHLLVQGLPVLFD